MLPYALLLVAASSIGLAWPWNVRTAAQATFYGLALLDLCIPQQWPETAVVSSADVRRANGGGLFCPQRRALEAARARPPLKVADVSIPLATGNRLLTRAARNRRRMFTSTFQSRDRQGAGGDDILRRKA